MLLTKTFQTILLCSFIFIALSVMTYAMYCKYRSKSFLGSGRITDIQTWAIKANVSWAISVVLTVVVVLITIAK
ncbi:hypothetical protein ACFQZX_07805 [Mucilaginibacter litoreus]|uniref:Uncharacterized protein n=1 Tax=Mucilaginibacter litoreus TaxID=1048221 RepID=A0ABW3ATC3_9SPHI